MSGRTAGPARPEFRHGMVVGKFYPPHAGHHALIEAAAARCAAVTVVVAPSRRESIPLELRRDWLREAHAHTPWVRFVGRYDDHPVDYADPAVWDAHCAVFRAALGGRPVDAGRRAPAGLDDRPVPGRAGRLRGAGGGAHRAASGAAGPSGGHLRRAAGRRLAARRPAGAARLTGASTGPAATHDQIILGT
ncbi:adenylyltransferase/cytidyltransferase family protein [Micromonospora sp. NPDC050200]|uniref:adenylyltransferase/cytidyltransferase family protein n=1 Tax=Micromonospora sp. NPDC050200 TaxID=3155664 RepID=UPI0033DCA8BF